MSPEEERILRASDPWFDTVRLLESNASMRTDDHTALIETVSKGHNLPRGAARAASLALFRLYRAGRLLEAKMLAECASEGLVTLISAGYPSDTYPKMPNPANSRPWWQKLEAGAVVAALGLVGATFVWLNGQTEAIATNQEAIKGIEKRLDERFEGLSSTLASLDGTLKRIDARLLETEKKVERIDERTGP